MIPITIKGCQEAKKQQCSGHELTDYARGLNAYELNKARAYHKRYVGKDECGEHQFEVTDQYGNQFNCRLSSCGKVTLTLTLTIILNLNPNPNPHPHPHPNPNPLPSPSPSP
jgi:hypothetical protein